MLRHTSSDFKPHDSITNATPDTSEFTVIGTVFFVPDVPLVKSMRAMSSGPFGAGLGRLVLGEGRFVSSAQCMLKVMSLSCCNTTTCIDESRTHASSRPSLVISGLATKTTLASDCDRSLRNCSGPLAVERGQAV